MEHFIDTAVEEGHYVWGGRIPVFSSRKVSGIKDSIISHSNRGGTPDKQTET